MINYTVADKSLSLIHKYKCVNHIKTMEENYKDIDEDGVRRLNFALGKAYEDIEDYKILLFQIVEEIKFIKKILIMI